MSRTPALLLTLSIAALPALAQEGRRAAIVFHEVPAMESMSAGRCDADSLDELNRDLTGSIRRNRIPALGLVVAGRCPDNDQSAAGALDLWKRAGLATRDQESSALPVTVSLRDDLYAAAYRQASERRDMPLARRIADDYVRYIESLLDYYEHLSADTLGYELPQIVQLDDSRLNADQLDRIVAMMRRRGYKFVAVDDALKDPAYRRPDVPGTGSILDRWAAHDRKKPSEAPAPPQWIESMVTGTDAR